MFFGRSFGMCSRGLGRTRAWTLPYVVRRDEADPALKRHIGPGPIEHHGQPIAEPDEPENVQKDPEQPGEKSGDSQSENVADRRSPSDGGHDAVIAIVERLKRLLSDGAHDVARRVRALLDRDLGDA